MKNYKIHTTKCVKETMTVQIEVKDLLKALKLPKHYRLLDVDTTHEPSLVLEFQHIHGYKEKGFKEEVDE